MKVNIARPILDDLHRIMNEGISVPSSVELWRSKHGISSEDWLTWAQENKDVFQGMIRQEIMYKRHNKISMNNLQEPKGQGGANSLIEAIQGRLLNVDRTEEGKPAEWHTMSCRCEKIIKECYSSFGVKFRDTHDNFLRQSCLLCYRKS